MRPLSPRALRSLGVALVLALAFSLIGGISAPALAVDSSPAPTASPSATPTPSATPLATPSASAETPSSQTSPQTSPQIGIPDPRGWVGDVFQASLVSLFGALGAPLRQTLQGIQGGSLGFVSSTPPLATYSDPLVHDLWGVVRIIANAALLLVVLGGGFGLVISEQTKTPYHEAMELFPRLILGVLLVNTSLSWAQLAIDLNNALCSAVGGARLPAWDQASAPSEALVEAIAEVVYFVSSLILVVQMLMRLALVDVLLVVSPIALLCWVLPQTQGWARLWSSTYFACVFTQFVQVLALRLGSALLGDSAVIAGQAVLLRLLLGVAVIVLTLKLPGLMRLHLDSGLGFVRYYAYRAGAQVVSGGAAKAGAMVGGARGRGGA